MVERRRRIETLIDELKSDQDRDRQDDRNQKVALFHLRIDAKRGGCRAAAVPAGEGLWNRVVAAAAPGMTAGQSPGRESEAAQRAVPADRLEGVVRAARQKATGGRHQRRNQQLIGGDRRFHYKALFRSSTARRPIAT